MSARLLDREFYRSSGKAHWRALILGEAALIFLALLGAVLTYLVERFLFHLVVLMPLFAGCALGFIADQVVEASRCRNRWLAAAAGLVAGCVAFFGTYYVALIWALKGTGWTRFDLIPALIEFNLKHTVFFAHHVAVNGGREPNPTFNAIMLAVEFFCVIGPATVFPFKKANRLYCEDCEKWADSISTTIHYHAAEPIVTAIATECWDDLPEFPTVEADVSSKKSPPYTLVKLEHCPDAPDAGCPLYLTIRRHPKEARADRVDIRRLEIAQDEALQLMARIPGLRGEEGTDDGNPGANQEDASHPESA
jgi:hypothetical protein